MDKAVEHQDGGVKEPVEPQQGGVEDDTSSCNSDHNNDRSESMEEKNICCVCNGELRLSTRASSIVNFTSVECSVCKTHSGIHYACMEKVIKVHKLKLQMSKLQKDDTVEMNKFNNSFR